MKNSLAFAAVLILGSARPALCEKAPMPSCDNPKGAAVIWTMKSEISPPDVVVLPIGAEREVVSASVSTDVRFGERLDVLRARSRRKGRDLLIRRTRSKKKS